MKKLLYVIIVVAVIAGGVFAWMQFSQRQAAAATSESIQTEKAAKGILTALVGATGSGKSHSIASVIQEVVAARDSDYDGLNNSHIVLFDIHSKN